MEIVDFLYNYATAIQKNNELACVCACVRACAYACEYKKYICMCLSACLLALQSARLSVCILVSTCFRYHETCGHVHQKHSGGIVTTSNVGLELFVICV